MRSEEQLGDSDTLGRDNGPAAVELYFLFHSFLADNGLGSYPNGCQWARWVSGASMARHCAIVSANFLLFCST